MPGYNLNNDFTERDCLAWKNENKQSADIIAELLPTIAHRASSNKYPWVFGPIKNSANYGIIHRNFSGNHFKPNTMDENSVRTFTSINLTHEESLLLQSINGIPVYAPLSPVALPFTFGLVFTLLVNIVTKESLEQQDIMLGFTSIVGSVMVLYPLMYKTVGGIKTLFKSPRVVNFSYQELLQISTRMAILLCLTLSIFPIAEKYIDIENDYLKALSVGAVTAIAMPSFGLAISTLTNEFKFTGFNKSTVRSVLQTYLPPLLTFPSLLVLQTVLYKYLFSESKVGDYNPKEVVNFGLLVAAILVLLENAYHYIVGSVLGYFFDDSKKVLLINNYPDQAEEGGENTNLLSNNYTPRNNDTHNNY